mmetsp:Transcript_96919/g.269627  ORF Transcript_96919/g.269627 Transcript_96919/m.269627 type:complete len:224 (-) Transcript_96919:216-887(-)
MHLLSAMTPLFVERGFPFSFQRCHSLIQETLHFGQAAQRHITTPLDLLCHQQACTARFRSEVYGLLGSCLHVAVVPCARQVPRLQALVDEGRDALWQALVEECSNPVSQCLPRNCLGTGVLRRVPRGAMCLAPRILATVELLQRGVVPLLPELRWCPTHANGAVGHDGNARQICLHSDEGFLANFLHGIKALLERLSKLLELALGRYGLLLNWMVELLGAWSL